MKVDVALPCMPSLVQTRVADYLELVRPRLWLRSGRLSAASGGVYPRRLEAGAKGKLT